MRKYISKILILFILIVFSTMVCGCWDYTEMNDVKYVAGFAVDKDKDTDEYILTSEVLEASISANIIKSNIIQSRGKTIHSALRDAIKRTGKMLQLSHAKVVIVSKDIAEQGIVPVIDLINRDVEVRNDMWILVSQMSTASEILTKSKKYDEIISYELADAIKNSNKIGKFNSIEVFKFIRDLSDKGISATASMVKVVKEEDKADFEVFGTAVFRKDKMIGRLSEEDTIILQILRGKKQKFIVPIELENRESISLEMMNVSRKVKVKKKDDKISMNMYINMDVALSELGEKDINYVSKENRGKLKKQAEKSIDKKIYNLIEKTQNEYKSDIVGFGDLLKKNKQKEWKKVSDNWNEVFKDIDINVFVNINIKYSGLNKKNIRVGI